MTMLARVFLFWICLSIIQNLLVLALLAFLTSIVWGLFYRPAETFGFLALVITATIVRAYPGWSLAVLGLLSITALIANIESE